MRNDPRIIQLSIIATVYNKEEYIQQFLLSVEEQNRRDFEVVLVDDGSTDNSPDIIDDFVSTHSFCRAIHQTNQGACMARNAGIKVASGEYIYIVDGDDWLAKDCVESIEKAISGTNADVIFGQVYFERIDRTIISEPFPQGFVSDDASVIKEIQCAFMNRNVIRTYNKFVKRINNLGGAPWRAVVRKSIIIDNDLEYIKGLVLGEDIIFWQNIFDHVNKVAYIQKPFYHYRQLDVSLSHGYNANLLTLYSHAFKEEELYLKRTKKDKDYWHAYYFRVILYIRQSIMDYYKHVDKGNGYKEFVRMVKSAPYHTAIYEVPIRKLIRVKPKIAILILRLKLYILYWWICI